MISISVFSNRHHDHISTPPLTAAEDCGAVRFFLCASYVCGTRRQEMMRMDGIHESGHA